jgi:hypothetical protein
MQSEMGSGLSPQKARRSRVLGLDKLVIALCLCWPWLKWKNWQNLGGDGKPLYQKDDGIFFTLQQRWAMATKAPFWHASWLGGSSTTDILHHQNEREGGFLKDCIMMHGLARLIWGKMSPLNILPNLWSFRAF